MTAVSLSIITLFISAWILAELGFVVGLALPPMIFLVLPHSIRWLKLNNRFFVSTMIASVLSVFSCEGLCHTPSIPDVVVSNTNPLLVVVPGDKAQHKLNEDYQHVHWCRRHG